MASELLNVQQLIASPDASLLHPPNTRSFHIPTFYTGFCVKPSTSQHQVIFKVFCAAALRDFGPFGLC